MRKGIARVTVVSTFAASALVGAVLPAFAGDKPFCVTVTVNSFNNVTIYNNCSRSWKLKVVWSYARDSGCFTVGPGGSKLVGAENQPLAQYDKVVTC
ncbi:hypothetical protein JOL79_28605 [Microbispora sp. RL4-1S]|uniref:Alpha-amylase n=1 Tax=Microbispora oryzae TaxID=2806554 RepID=A0A940WV44_9ACTN|nr:hypothetical protein [Microbispora oryzae]MBP2707751.1 hypothetical protein [Microbispora oryzae]